MAATDTKDRKTTRIQAINRERILDAAEAVFADSGFKGSTVDQIALSAGMSKPNLLYYFPTKRELYLAALGRTLDTWLESLLAIRATGDPEAEITTYIRRKIAFSQAYPLASRVFANEIIQGAPVLRALLEGRLRRIVDEKAAIIRGWMKEGRLARRDPYHLIFSIWAVTQHYADFAVQIEALLGKTLDDEAFKKATEKAVLDLLLNGILPRG